MSRVSSIKTNVFELSIRGFGIRRDLALME